MQKSLFAKAQALAAMVPAREDIRPAWLRALRDAEHPTAPYYRFLYDLSIECAPLDVIEVGTFVGTSAAHLAAGGGTVLTIDINPDAKIRVDSLKIPNIEAITADSAQAVKQLQGKMFDVAYIDGWHDFNQTYGEYVLYRQFVREGGLLIFDDVGLDMEGDEMEVFWEFVVEPKQRLDHLHTTGFGMVEKVNGTQVPAWKDVVDAAKKRIDSKIKGNG